MKSLPGSDFVNVFLVEGNYLEKVFSDNFELLKPHPDKGVFVSVSYLGFRTQPCSAADVGEEVCVPACEMLPDFKERVDAFVRFLKERGYYEQVIGFYMDEPMLWGVTNEQLELFTGYFRTQAAPTNAFSSVFRWRESRPNTGRSRARNRSRLRLPVTSPTSRSICIIHGAAITKKSIKK